MALSPRIWIAREQRLWLWPTVLSASTMCLPGVAVACPDCAPDELIPLQLAANARGAIMGLLTLTLLLVVAVVVAGACLKYTRRLLFAGAMLFGGGVGALIERLVVQDLLLFRDTAAPNVGGALGSVAEWFSRGNFALYCAGAALLGCFVVFTEAPNVIAVTRNRLLPGGMITGVGAFNLLAGLWHSALFSRNTDQAWVTGFVALGLGLCATGVALVIPVLKHKTASVARATKRVTAH